jgi:hypothetical protein
MSDEDQLEKLLTELNYLEREYGRVLEERDPNYDVSGPARARIQLLKGQLEKLGVNLAWDGQKYNALPPANDA